ncbi:unnamed protein product [Paramecium pentaurelia]|uniref:Uncharacterized protein n=1 Tax=Paramecium pentaurelia TaxID=43138 RepID=A0A8S1VYW9_9CILI|nr:unnamed protein product [Paramecium pentaurelia]
MATALGLGYGTIAILAGFVLALLITFFFGRSTRSPELVCLLTMLIPIILIIIFTASPKKSQILTDSDQVDSYLPVVIFAMVFGIVSALGALLCILGHYYFQGLRAIRISSQLEMERDKQKLERKKPA